MKSMKDLKKKLHGLHVLHGNLSCFVVPARAWMLLQNKSLSFQSVFWYANENNLSFFLGRM